MQCAAARKYLYNLGPPDDERGVLPIPAELTEARRHLEGCVACQEFFAAEKRLADFVRARAAREKAPATLREQVLAYIAQGQKPFSGVQDWVEWIGRRGLLFGLIGSLAISVLLAGLWLSQRRGRLTPQQFVSAVVDDHAVNAQTRAEIASSDREAVQKWFRERVDFAFRLPSTSDPELVGGRLCYLKGRRAALVFFQRLQSRMSLFILDGTDLNLPEHQLIQLDNKRCLLDARKGYNVVLWKERGVVYSLVSDVQATDLLQLAERF